MEIKRYRLRDTGNTSDQSWQKLGIVSVYAMEVQISRSKWKHLQNGPNREYAYGLEQGIKNFRYHARQHKVHAYQIVDSVTVGPFIHIPFGYTIINLYDSTGAGNTSPQYYKPVRENADKEDYNFDGDFHNTDGSVKVFKEYTDALSFVRKQAGPQEYPYD